MAAIPAIMKKSGGDYASIGIAASYFCRLIRISPVREIMIS
jgi:hypothetical protein